MQNHSTVIFLGNGYDVASGYKTKYSDFYQDETFKELCKTNHLAFYISLVNNSSNNWSDLEEQLYNYSCFIKHVKNNGGVHPGMNISAEAIMSLKKAAIAQDSAELFHSEFKELQNCLGNYIVKATTSNQNHWDESQRFLKFLTNDWLDEDGSTLLISFNYTDIFYGTHGRANIQYVHGSVKTLVHDKQSGKKEPYGTLDTNNIVLGIDEEMEVETPHSFLYKSYNETTDIHHLASILSSAKRYIIFGCSLGVSDKWYFDKIFNSQQTDKTYEIYHYGGEDQLSINSRIKEISKENIADFKERNSVLYLDSSDLEKVLSKRKEYYTEYPFKP
ncbi:MAG: hypothetical protein IKN98_01070 [Bacteroidales bacterium]|nr:hypothetical protein [Bacteroidales bacterium]